jgi:hypothetical protein
VKCRRLTYKHPCRDIRSSAVSHHKYVHLQSHPHMYFESCLTAASCPSNILKSSPKNACSTPTVYRVNHGTRTFPASQGIQHVTIFLLGDVSTLYSLSAVPSTSTHASIPFRSGMTRQTRQDAVGGRVTPKHVKRVAARARQRSIRRR